jgi:hypothetical protein
MTIRHRIAARVLAIVAVCAVLLGATGMAQRPDVRIPLEPLGFQPLSKEFLLAGSSMLTVDFVDQTHLLVSFSVRRLMKRDENAEPEDLDRTIKAVLLELPSGKVLASAEWRLHDRAQYLWNLGHGRFLLRVRNRLTILAPLEATIPEDALVEHPFLKVQRRILAVVVSADSDLMTVESMDRPATPAAPRHDATRADVLTPEDEPQPNAAPVQLNFYRLSGAHEGQGLIAQAAGVLRARTAIAITANAHGFLEVLEGGHSQWAFNFNTHDGHTTELATFDTTCFPRATFVSATEFVAFGCRGSADRQDFAAFNLKGEEMWQQNFFELHAFPSFAFAPAADRFALGRTLLNSTLDPNASDFSSQITSEEVRVYQTYNGRMLFHIAVSPVERAGQSFALSADGLRVAVVRETTRPGSARNDEPAIVTTTAVEVYPLPALTPRDMIAVKEASAPESAEADVPIRLSRKSSVAGSAAHAVAPAEPPAPTLPAYTPGTPAPALSAASAPATLPDTSVGTVEDPLSNLVIGGTPAGPDPSAPQPSRATALGDAAPADPATPAADAPRPPPSLYAPGEPGRPK